MPETFDTGFDLIPGEESVSADQQLQAALSALVPDTQPDVKRPFGRGWAFDFERNEFVAHGQAPAVVYGLDNLRVWIEKTLRTARLAHPIYSDDYGTEEPFEAVGKMFTPALAGRMTRSITDALLVHDRITEIRDFRFEGGIDSNTLYVSFTVITDDEHLELQRLTVLREII